MIVDVFRRNMNEHLVTVWTVHSVFVSGGKFHLVNADGRVDHFECKDVALRISY